MDEEDAFTFIFNDKRKIILTQNQVINISTSFYYKHVNKDNGNIIKLPDNITYENFSEFLEIFQKNAPIIDDQTSQENKLIVSENADLVQLIQISEFFENDSFSIFLINEFFLYGDKKITKKNAYLLLILSYNKLNELNNNNYNNEEEIESIWLDLFMKSLDIVGKNLLFFFEDKKLEVFDKKIIDELFEKYSMYLISNDFLIDFQENKNDEKLVSNNINNNNNEKNENNNNNMNNINTINKENIDKNISGENKSIKSNIKSNENNNNIINDNENYISLTMLRKIIEFLINRRTQNDFFCLLSNEFMKISSEENINEITNLPNPTFLLKLDINDINNYYEEFPIENQINNNEQKKIIFTIYYKKTEDSFNVALKLTKLEKNNALNNNNNNNNNNIISTANNTLCNFDILTFLSSASIDELEVKQINIKSISNNKSMHEILKINNFSKLLSLISKEYITLKIFLKPCYTHSMLCSYLFYNFDELYNNKNINKIPKNLLNIIIRKKQVNNNENNMDKIVMCLFNWLNDEINIKEDISEIIENIKWNDISLPLLFEFIIKYAKNITQTKLEHIFLNSLIGRSKNYSNIELFSQEIIKSLFISSKNMDYISLFCENQRLNKFNSYEKINQERNNISQNDILQNKNSIDNKNSNQTSEKFNLVKNFSKENNNDSFVINNYGMKQNKSTTNLNNNKMKLTNSNIRALKNKKFDITNSPKIKNREKEKKNIDNFYNNKRNKSIDYKYMSCKNNKTSNNKKKFHKIYFESNNKKNIFNKSLYDKKIFKIINSKDNNEYGKKSKNKISLITELNKLKLKVK